MRILLRAALLLLASVIPAMAQNTATPASGDVILALRCPVSPCRFRLGEVIRLEVDFIASKNAYRVEYGGSEDGLTQRATASESFTAAPEGCVSDPLEGSTVVMNGSGISGNPPLSPGKPFPLRVELNQWLRFGCPGKYQVSVRSNRAFGTADGPAAGFQHRQTLISAPLEIEIVPADAAWQKEQLARILPDLPAPGAPYSWRADAALRALGYLGSDDALREIRKHISEVRLSLDFIHQNTYYILDWEMARLELLRH